MENKIAVIIPAYKDTYLLNTLISINNQTDKKFNLYICNDSSPYNIEKVLADFKKINKIHFEYIKFENNLGGSDLIQHWNRCINQIKNEEWIRISISNSIFNVSIYLLFLSFVLNKDSSNPVCVTAVLQ